MNLNIKNLKTCSRKEINVSVFNVGTHKALCFFTVYCCYYSIIYACKLSPAQIILFTQKSVKIN